MSEIKKLTKRLCLRPLRPSDYPLWRETYLNLPPKKNKWDYRGRSADSLTRKEFQKTLRLQKRLLKTGERMELAIFHRKTKNLIGIVSAMDIVRGVTHSAYLGYTIYNPHWGQGYGKEAVAAFLQICFRQLKLHRMEAGVEPRNLRSIRLAKGLGLRYEGLKRRMVFLREHWVDLRIYAITCEEYGITWKNVKQKR